MFHSKKKVSEALDAGLKELMKDRTLSKEDLEFWILQFRTRGCNGHSEWSERFQRNIWIKDDEEC